MSEQIDRLCAELSPTAVSHHYATLADECAGKKQSFTDYLEAGRRTEHALRQERSRQMLIKLATLPVVKTLEEIDFDPAPGVPKARVQELAGLGGEQGHRDGHHQHADPADGLEPLAKQQQATEGGAQNADGTPGGVGHGQIVLAGAHRFRQQGEGT